MAASDIWGTILAHRVGEQMELATLVPPGEERRRPPPPAPRRPPCPRPPSSPLATLAEAIGASTAIAREPGKVTVFADGTTTEVATPPDVYVQTDGTLLWWDIVTGETTSRSAAATLDGTIVCEVEGVIHRIRQDPDGGYVASVERARGDRRPPRRPPCRTTPSTVSPAIRSRSNPSGGRGRSAPDYRAVGDRTFTDSDDAEGNADVTNEAGISINGDDYAGYHDVLRRRIPGRVRRHDGPDSRDDRLAVTRHHDGRAAVERRARSTGRPDVLVRRSHRRPGPRRRRSRRGVEAVIVLDAVTGEVIETVPTTLDLAFVD